MWTQGEVIDLCIDIEEIAPKFGYHVALTGGCLYKEGRRKDADILFYIHKKDEQDQNWAGLMQKMRTDLQIIPGIDHGRCKKASFMGKNIDFFFPEEYPDDEYPIQDEEVDMNADNAVAQAIPVPVGLNWVNFDEVRDFLRPRELFRPLGNPDLHEIARQHAALIEDVQEPPVRGGAARAGWINRAGQWVRGN